jgi:gliding motility-associated-like protein
VVVAYNSDSTIASFSNVVNINADLFPKPQFNYVSNVSVNHETEAIELSCRVDNTAVIDYYRVLRSTRDKDVFSDIASIPFNGQLDISYTDYNANTSSNFYNYHVYPVDTCGVTIYVGSTQFAGDTSFAQSILIESVANKDMINDIVFNKYDGWLGDDVQYNLYRSVNRGDFSALPLATYQGGSESYSYHDKVEEFVDGNGRFCYYVEALEGNTNPYGFVERSLSNITCISQVPILIVPNTFTPNDDEHNELFLPTTSYVSEIGYSFAIYDNWGREIFQTNNPTKGWDGKYMGNPVQNGNYVYHVKYINGVGMLTEKTDVVSLIR